jgi:hypothetical protein
MRYLPPCNRLAKLPNICVIGKYPDSNLDPSFRDEHASAGARLDRESARRDCTFGMTSTAKEAKHL